MHPIAAQEIARARHRDFLREAEIRRLTRRAKVGRSGLAFLSKVQLSRPWLKPDSYRVSTVGGK